MSAKEFAAGIMTRYNKDRLQVLVQDSEKVTSGKALTELPGGMSEVQDNGNPEKILRSEFEEETGYRIKPTVEPRIVHEALELEVKKFYFHFWRSNCRGSRRTKDIRDGFRILHPPYWEDIEVLLEKRNFRNSHRRGLRAFRSVTKL